jgi:outer membrane protein assembly factor BamB
MGLLRDLLLKNGVARLALLFSCAWLLGSCSHLKLDRPLRVSEADWPTYGGDAGRSNRTEETLKPPLSLVWKNDVTGGIGNGAPLVVDSFIIVGTLRGELHVLNALTGKRKGWIGLGDAIQGSPVVDKNIVYAATSNSDESLVAFDVVAGKLVWKMNYGDIEVSPLLVRGRLYVGNVAGKFSCVNSASGERVWEFHLPENSKFKGIRSSPAYGNGAVFFGADDGLVYALDSETGAVRWKHDTGSPVVAPATFSAGSVFVGNLRGEFFSLNAATGEKNWMVAFGGSIFGGAAVAEDRVIAGSTGGRVSALDVSAGTTLWSVDLGEVVNSAPLVSGEYVYVGTLKKKLYGLNLRDGATVVRQEVEGRIKTTPTVGLGRLFVASDERWIMAFSGENGQ